jgi:hypothetical protein
MPAEGEGRKRAGLVWFSDVKGAPDDLAPGGFDGRYRPIQLLLCPGTEHDPGAFFGEELGCGSANPTACPGDDGDQPGETTFRLRKGGGG